VRHAKGDADEEKGEVFSGVSERLKIMSSIISLLRSSSLKLPFKLSSILSTACLHGHTDMALMLLDCGADINYVDADGNSNLHHAVCNDGHSNEMLRMLIKKGIDVKRFINAINNDDNAPLNMLYCGYKQTDDENETNSLLLSLGAHVNLKK
jgi:ankyrin repeat protein